MQRKRSADTAAAAAAAAGPMAPQPVGKRTHQPLPFLPLPDLPDDVMSEIIQHTDSKTLVALGSASKTLRTIALPNVMFHVTTPDSLQRMLSCMRRAVVAPVSSRGTPALGVQHLTIRVPHMKIYPDRLTETSAYDVYDPDCMRNLQHLILETGSLEEMHEVSLSDNTIDTRKIFPSLEIMELNLDLDNDYMRIDFIQKFGNVAETLRLHVDGSLKQTHVLGDNITSRHNYPRVKTLSISTDHNLAYRIDKMLKRIPSIYDSDDDDDSDDSDLENYIRGDQREITFERNAPRFIELDSTFQSFPNMETLELDDVILRKHEWDTLPPVPMPSYLQTIVLSAEHPYTISYIYFHLLLHYAVTTVYHSNYNKAVIKQNLTMKFVLQHRENFMKKYNVITRNDVEIQDVLLFVVIKDVKKRLS